MKSRYLAILCIALSALACTTPGPYVWANQLPPAAAGPAGALRIGDRVQLAVQGQESVSGEFEVRPTGEIVLPAVGKISAAGLTIEQFRQQVTARVSGFFQNPQVTVVLAARKAPFVSVVGEVRTPGRYELRDGEGVLDALARAAGFTPFASKDGIYVIQKAHRGPRVRFRYQDLAGADPASVGFELRDGDIVIVE
ncbi:MAG TPA: polysaccharide biosynthesis/export family protein [Polyangiaceae bacterium]|nr:polysaccharide biosynthesis/export family protein [Polyangiaceae bacterium]